MSQVSKDLFHKITVKVPRGHQGYWDIIKAMGANEQSFVLHDIYMRTNAHTASVADYVKRLVKAKYLKVAKVEKLQGVARMYHYVVLKPVINAPRLRRDGSECLPTLTQYMWQTMRALKGSFNAAELADIATTEENRAIKTSSANKYLIALHKAGYLMRIGSHDNKQLSRYIYLSDMDTGELAPQIMRSKMVWDQNILKIMGEPSDLEEVAA